MAEATEVSRKSDLKEGEMKAVNAAGREILLARVGDTFYAADNRCPHMGGRLSQGKLDSTVVTCPLHGSRFDLKNGEVVRWLKGAGLLSKIGKALKSPQPLTTYPVTTEDERVMVEI